MISEILNFIINIFRNIIINSASLVSTLYKPNSIPHCNTIYNYLEKTKLFHQQSPFCKITLVDYFEKKN